MKKVFLGFVPWIVFTLVCNRLGPGAVGTAAVLSFLVACALIVRSVRRGEAPKVLEVTGAVVFLGLGAVAVTTPNADGFLAGYGRALAALVLALVIFLLLPVLPFTEQYARESVPREYWHTHRFRAVNRRISAAWGAIVALMTVSHVIAGAFEVPDPGIGVLHRPVDLVFNWLVPGLLVWAAAHYTQHAARSDDEPGTVPSPREPATAHGV